MSFPTTRVSDVLPHSDRASMQVTKRDESLEPVAFDAITERIALFSKGIDVDPVVVAKKVISGIYDKIPTWELDELAAETAAYLATQHPDYSILAGRLACNNHWKRLDPARRRFSANIAALAAYVHPRTDELAPLVSHELAHIVAENADVIDAKVEAATCDLDYFAFHTLKRSYFLKMHEQVCETAEMMYMRVALGIHGEDLEDAFETFDLFVEKFISHATPTLFNSGTPKPQMSSCFLLHMKDDSLDGIYDTLKDCAVISKYAGGVGVSIHNIRASDSYIRGTNGVSNGLVPMLRVYSDTARYVDQGGGKRKGSFAIYLEPWHADIFEFLELKKNHGKEEQRARDLFYAMWTPELFIKRVIEDGSWSLFCPNEARGLSDVWGDEFEALYERYEHEGKFRKQVRAQELWFAIMESQIETGTPYLLNKDECNRSSNHQHLGTIKSSNLCTEIVQYTAPDEIAVCNLASLILDSYIKEDGSYDHDALCNASKILTRNLNKIIDKNHYPLPETEYSNLKHRPVGIGVCGLADTFVRMNLAYTSAAARKLNRDIFETIYFGAWTASWELAVKDGPYETFPGSPLSRGLFQFDMRGCKVDDSRYNWTDLRAKIMRDGARNSLVTAPMPTASTAQIVGRQESFEPFFQMLYSRRVLAGDFPLLNAHLVRDLVKRGLWSTAMRSKLIANRGSVQDIDEISKDLKMKYMTVWEIPHKWAMTLAADRQNFIDQSQSFSAHIKNPTPGQLTSMLKHAYTLRLKTIMYYLRTKPKATPIAFAHIAEQQALAGPLSEETTEDAPLVCPRRTTRFKLADDEDDEDESCLACGS